MKSDVARSDQVRRLMTPSARSDVPPFMVMDVMAAAARIEAAGGQVVHMEVGQPAVGAPSPAVAAAQAALASGRPLGYTESLGTASLRARIARHYAEAYHQPIAADRVIVTTGSSAGFILAFLSMFEPGDRVAIASPGYPPYRHILRALDCEPVLIETDAATRFAITGESLRAVHARTPLAGLLVASPANPTGTMMAPQALADLIETASDLGIRFISDEIYHGLDYAMPAQTALQVSDDVVVINSFSKYFCMTGWRIGWMVVPETMVRPIDRLQGNLAISVPTLSQIAAEAAFDGRTELDTIKHGYEDNRKILIEGLPKTGLDRFLPVDGAFYLYADISAFSRDSVAFTRRLLEEARVAATPGVDFDPVRGNEFVRFSYAGSATEMREAVERIGAWLRRG
ncbi:MAG: aminotransferase class I/II-fold pyridoxal phosphate-dependent enzyme [Rhizobiales bacterium]|nr:aminotransferase class I/II-fold pyridoxal phosphate-dependent enzyme [Hyphomicrobiales bacterium]